MSDIEIRVPELGDLKGADVVAIPATIGAEVAAEATLLQLESEKAVMEVTSPAAGRVAGILVGVGDRVTSGQLVVRLSPAADTAAPASTAPVPVSDTSPAPPVATASRTTEPAGQPVYAGPATRRLAHELGVDLLTVHPTGPRDRILVDDVKAHVRSGPTGAAAAAPPPGATEADFERFGPVEYEPLSRIRKISARRLASSWTTIPHVTQHNEADITDLEALRLARRQALESSGARLTLLAFLLRAVSIALGEMPRFNASLSPDGERLALKRHCHLGFAADTEHGLVVPVVRDADRKDVYELATELGDLSTRARSGRLTAAEMQGSTFTVSSLGGVGGTHFTPIVNPPEVAILGAGRARRVPACIGDRIEPRLVLPVSLSYDHRVIDGVAGVRFTERLCALLADPTVLIAAVA